MSLYYKAKDGTEYPYISVASGMSGYFAVMIWRNPDLGGFEEPYETGIGRYKTVQEAQVEAESWAKEEDVDYIYHDETIKGSYKGYKSGK